MSEVCVSIAPKNIEELEALFFQAEKKINLIEIRLDYFDSLPFHMLRQYVGKRNVIFRPDEKKTVDDLLHLAKLAPSYIDLPHTTDVEIFQLLKKEAPCVTFICSYHDFEKTPENIFSLFEKLQIIPADIYKIVTTATSGLDGLKMLHFVLQASKIRPLIAHTMGDPGSFTRILSPLFGSLWSYGCLEGQSTAKGQISYDEMQTLYHIDKLSKKTGCFALIGDPLFLSPSHKTHNSVMQELDIDAVYVKIPLTREEIQQGFQYIDALKFLGLSITMPLKYAWDGKEPGQRVPYNTAKNREGMWSFYNTDGDACLESIASHIKNGQGKKMIVVGAGATAFSIAKNALYAGYQVSVVNRTHKKAKILSDTLKCQAFSLDKLAFLLEEKCDVLVNATSCSMDAEHTQSFLLDLNLPKHLVVLDVAVKKTTPFLELAKKAGCQVVPGTEMWLKQAAKQFAIWFGKNEKYYDLLKKALLLSSFGDVT